MKKIEKFFDNVFIKNYKEYFKLNTMNMTNLFMISFEIMGVDVL